MSVESSWEPGPVQVVAPNSFGAYVVPLDGDKRIWFPKFVKHFSEVADGNKQFWFKKVPNSHPSHSVRARFPFQIVEVSLSDPSEIVETQSDATALAVPSAVTQTGAKQAAAPMVLPPSSGLDLRLKGFEGISNGTALEIVKALSRKLVNGVFFVFDNIVDGMVVTDMVRAALSDTDLLKERLPAAAEISQAIRFVNLKTFLKDQPVDSGQQKYVVSMTNSEYEGLDRKALGHVIKRVVRVDVKPWSQEDVLKLAKDNRHFRSQLELRHKVQLDDEAVSYVVDFLAKKSSARNLLQDVYDKLESLSIEHSHSKVGLSDAVRALSPIKRHAATSESALSKLDALIGLDKVKEQVLTWRDIARHDFERQQEGIEPPVSRRHLIFTGNPGTGKTTVARLIGQILHGYGMLSTGNTVEYRGTNLIGEYVGHTTPKVRNAVESALGGVLFIDEAYALAQGGMGINGASFSAEAIAELLQLMEDHSDDLVVIAAGYKDEMEQFLAMNDGLRSRFATIIDFPDYSDQELLSIFEAIAKKNHYDLGNGVTQKFLRIIPTRRPQHFGNGRDVENVFMNSHDALARRIGREKNVDRNVRDTIIADDLPDEWPSTDHKTGSILGFRP